MTMTFEDLDAWKKARELVNVVYEITRRSSLSKDFGLRFMWRSQVTAVRDRG